MISINRVQLIGEIKSSPNFSDNQGKELARFTVLTCDYYKVAGKRHIERQWHEVVAFGKQAILVKLHLKQGDEIVVDGSISKRKCADENGGEIVITEIIAHDIMYAFTKRA